MKPVLLVLAALVPTMETYLRELGRKFGETVQPQP